MAVIRIKLTTFFFKTWEFAVVEEKETEKKKISNKTFSRIYKIDNNKIIKRISSPKYHQSVTKYERRLQKRPSNLFRTNCTIHTT